MKTLSLTSKRILAREILIFFFGISIAMAIWGVAATKNAYEDHFIDKLFAKNDAISKEIKELPLSYVGALENTSYTPSNTSTHDADLKPVTDPKILAILNAPNKVPEYSPETKNKKDFLEQQKTINDNAIVSYTNRKFDLDNIAFFLLIVSMWVFLFLYVLRGVIYSLWWAIKHFKMTEDKSPEENIA